jgi:predicted Zn finger-like uncharacterized protein
MNIRCPHCQTLFRVDPARVPAHGIRARCARCGGTFQIPGSAAAGATPAARRPAEAEAEGVRKAEAVRKRDAEAVETPVPAAGPDPGILRQSEGVVEAGSSGPPQPAAPEPRHKPAPVPGPPEVIAPKVPAEPAARSRPQAEPEPQPEPAAPPASGSASAPLPPAAAAAGAAGARAAKPVFGSRDPNARALRIARALVSDIVAYHPDRRKKALAAGTLRAEFRDEIMKSWEEYVAQVGQELAKSTPYFRQSLNEILAQGQNVF